MPYSVLSPYTIYSPKKTNPPIKSARAYMRARVLTTIRVYRIHNNLHKAVQVVMSGFRFAYGLVVRHLVAYSLHDSACVLIELR